MKTFLANLRSIVVAGFLFLVPVYVLLVVFTRAWTQLSSMGTSVARMFGLQSIIGVGASTVVSGVLLIAIWLICGLLVRISFVEALNKAVESQLSKYVPGYSTYKAMAEDKLHNRLKMLPYASALIRLHDYWQPAYVVEQDDEGHYVVFVPSAPDTNSGRVLLANRDQLRLVPSMTASQLDASLKKMGRGLLSEYAIHQR